jgi:hypothetical protein
MKKVCLISLLSIFLLPAFGQTVLMEEYPGNDTIVPTFGKNLKHYMHLYFSYSVFADNFSNDKAESKIPGSSDFSMGIRYKRKITTFYAMGFDLGMNTSGFSVKQTDQKTFPSQGKHKKEVINTTGLSLEYYNRINFDRRGNKTGKFADIGAYGFYNFNSWHFTRDEFDTLTVGYTKVIEVKHYKPDYLNNYGYGCSFRLGFNSLVLTARYRLSDLVKKEGNYTDFPELPRLNVGLQISIPG